LEIPSSIPSAERPAKKLDHPALRRNVAHGRRDDEFFEKNSVGNRRFVLFNLRQTVGSISGVELLQRATRAALNLDACCDLVDLLSSGV